MLCGGGCGDQDLEYRARRKAIVEGGAAYRHGDRIPRVTYSPQEVATWGVVYSKLKDYSHKYAVQQVGAGVAAPLSLDPL